MASACERVASLRDPIPEVRRISQTLESPKQLSQMFELGTGRSA